MILRVYACIAYDLWWKCLHSERFLGLEHSIVGVGAGRFFS